MKQVYVVVSSILLSFCSLAMQAQQTVATDTNVIVPPLVNFSGTLTDTNGRPGTSNVAVTFSLYSEQAGGAALWMESQNVEPDSRGHYTVMLGSTSSSGLPADIFVAGEAHWLGVRVQGQEEQPRVLLVSAPYALKAGDAQTLGGLPASAFVLAAPHAGGASRAATEAAAATTNKSIAPAVSSKVAADVTTSGGAANTIAMFTTATNIQNSLLTQTGTTTINVGGLLNLPATGTATATGGRISQAQDFIASAYNSSAAVAVPQKFQWQAEPAGNDTATASGTLNLLYGSGPAKPAETGLHIASNGQITFAAGQTFSGNSAAIGVVGTTTGTLPFNSGVEGVASTTSGSATGVYGTSASTGGFGVAGFSNTNVGVFGDTSGTSSTSYGVEGSVTGLTGAGTGVFGNSGFSTAGYGVEGTSLNVGVYGNATGTSSYGVLGSSPNVGVSGNATGTASYGVRGTSPNVGLFGSGTGTGGIGVDGHGNAIGVKGVATASGGLSGYFGGGPVEIAGNGNNAFFGDPGCGSGFSGFGLTTDSLSGCVNYTLIGKSSGDIYLNSTGSASIHFRNGNSGGNSDGDLATIDHSGNLTVSGKVHSGNVAAQATANTRTSIPGNCTSLLTSGNSACDIAQMSVTETTGGGPVFVMANLSGIWTLDSCVGSDFYLVVDGKIVYQDFIQTGGPGGTTVSTTMAALVVPSAGPHTFEVQGSDDIGACGGSNPGTVVSGTTASGGFTSPDATRTLIVREF
jgi:trimeric autotransporter adhesin